MKREGPALEVLLRRIAEIPAEFLLTPRIGAVGEVHVPAVVRDTLRSKGLSIPLAELAAFAGRDPKVDRARLSATLVVCWVIADPALEVRAADLAGVMQLLREDAAALAAQTGAARILKQAERREELARLTLERLDMRPAGESIAQAQDRLTALSSAERARVIRASREAEARARSIREALVRKAAQESADKWTRE